MWGGRLNSQIINFLDSENPDIVCLQEAVDFDGDIALFLGTIQAIQANVNQPYTEVFFSPAFRFKFMNKSAGFGNCILSRYPAIEKQISFTHLGLEEDFSFDKHSYNARNFQHARLDTGQAKINVLNHHGYHIAGHKKGDANTIRQMKQLGEYIDNLSGPVMVTGDFNLAPDSKSLGQINTRLTNLSLKHGLKTTRTNLTPKTEVCDYIFVNDKVKVKSFGVSEKLISDHKALILEFDI